MLCNYTENISPLVDLKLNAWVFFIQTSLHLHSDCWWVWVFWGKILLKNTQNWNICINPSVLNFLSAFKIFLYKSIINSKYWHLKHAIFVFYHFVGYCILFIYKKYIFSIPKNDKSFIKEMILIHVQLCLLYLYDLSSRIDLSKNM